MNQNFNLNSIALITEFNASVWTARKLDRKVTDDVVHNAGATAKSAARVNKNLLAGRSELAIIESHVTTVRQFLYSNTSPWSDTGQRLLPMTRFPVINQRMEDFKGAFDTMVADFVTVYPTLITAQAMALGAMFNRAEFPPANTIASKFAFTFDVTPVPAAGDWRVDVGNQAQDELRERLTTMGNARVEKAMLDLTERFVTHLRRMADRLVTDRDAKTGDPVGRRFTETLVSGAFDLCDLIKDCNFTGDVGLTQARLVLENALGGVTAVALREDPIKREEVRGAVSNILGQFQFASI